jgi:iduronate 2-sulfatase
MPSPPKRSYTPPDRVRRGARGASLFLVCVGWFVLAHAANRPNVLFIAIDDLRPELGCYGNTPAQTPQLDRLARSGTVFQRAYCQQALCAPSRASLLTGLRPDSLGILDLSHPVRETRPEVRTLPQLFRAAGYTTLSLGKIYHHLKDDNGVGWSAPAWEPANAWSQAIDADNAARGQARSTAWEAAEVGDDAYPDGLIAARAIAELRRFKETGTPFFLAVGFLKPHLPFFAPKRYWDLYARAKFVLPAQRQWPAGMPPIAGMNSEELRQYRGIPKSGPMDDELARTLIHGYFACISYVDAMVGQVLAELDRSGLRENTIVVVLGDHGWKLDEYGAWCKHTNFELDTRAPLIVSVPGQRRTGASEALVEFVDVYPTLAQLAGLDATAKCEGTSFVPLLDDPARPWKAAAFSVYPRGAHLMGYTVRDARWRYTEWIDRRTGAVMARELYDHATSAVAAANLADDPAHASEVERLAQLLAHGSGWRQVREHLAPVK